MEIDGYEFPDDLYYDHNHYWARVEGDTVVMGATDFSQQLAGDLTFVDVDQEGEESGAGQALCLHRIRQVGRPRVRRGIRRGGRT